MAAKMRAKEGKEEHKMRKETVECPSEGMVKERGGAARASRGTEQREDKIRNKHVYCDIAGL